MTYTPKPGDRVTSPLLVGEWEVTQTDRTMELYVSLRQGRALLPSVLAERLDLHPVAPPLPPEPPVGSVVRAHGALWLRTEFVYAYLTEDGDPGPWFKADGQRRQWPYLTSAPDLSPVVALEDVAEWLERNTPTVTKFSGRLRAEFGGWGE